MLVNLDFAGYRRCFSSGGLIILFIYMLMSNSMKLFSAFLYLLTISIQ